MTKTSFLLAPIKEKQDLGISYYLDSLFVCFKTNKQKNPKSVTIHSTYFKYASNFVYVHSIKCDTCVFVCL